MERKEKTGNVEYKVVGKVGYWIERPADSDIFCGAELDEKIEADNDKSAIKQAQEIVEEFLKVNKKYCPKLGEEKENDKEWPKILSFSLIRIVPIWSKKYFPPKNEQPAVESKPAVAAAPSYMEEVVYSR